MLNILGSVAEFERTLIRERSIAGQISAIKNGRWPGRPKKLTDDQELELFDLWTQGTTRSELALKYNVSYDVVRLSIFRFVQPDHPRVYGNRKVLGPILGEKRAAVCALVHHIQCDTFSHFWGYATAAR